MASVFKKTYTKPLPASAKLITRNGERYAEIKDQNGRTQRVPLTTCGERCRFESSKWYVKYTDADGIERVVPGYKDKEATRQKAAKLERQAERGEAGIEDQYREHRKRPLSGHLADYKQLLEQKERSKNYVNTTEQRIKDVLDGCKATVIGDVTASKVRGFLAGLRKDGASISSRNHYLTALKMFFGWLRRDGRMKDDPLVGLERLNSETDRRRQRRALTLTEFDNLLHAALRGPDVQRLPGSDRAMLYILAASTGYRRNELASIVPSSFDFEAKPPTVTVEAGYSKRKRRDVVPLRQDVADIVSGWLTGKGELEPNMPLLNVRDKRTAEMLKRDLKAAGIAYRDDRGRVVDFHSLRVTFITNLARSGASPKVAQTLARHSDINLTMNTYTQLEMSDQSDAVQSLPAMPLAASQLAPQLAPQLALTLDSEGHSAASSGTGKAIEADAAQTVESPKTSEKQVSYRSTKPHATIHLPTGAVAELADALDLGSSSFGSAGSIPVSPIRLHRRDLRDFAVSPLFMAKSIWGQNGDMIAFVLNLHRWFFPQLLRRIRSWQALNNATVLTE